MKTFKKCAAQGDVLFRKVEKVPEGATKVEKFDGVVAHSETGHHHKFVALEGIELFTTKDPFVSFLKVAPKKQFKDGVELKHYRPFDTHESLLFEKGIYEIRRQREYTPEGWRMVQD